MKSSRPFSEHGLCMLSVAEIRFRDRGETGKSSVPASTIKPSSKNHLRRAFWPEREVGHCRIARAIPTAIIESSRDRVNVRRLALHMLIATRLKLARA
jgi:hypothetical protein